ncbi:MAG: discoidin domain-containing protein [Tannerella sp.]|jgi:hypothetical protein|nr:discoidin domain-containing protein [Tannerella sp.]
MKTKNLIYTTILAALFTGLFYSCNDDGIPKTLEFDQFKYVWMTSASEDDRSLILYEERDTTLTLGKLRYGGITTPFSTEIVAEIGVDNSLIPAYNTANNTDYAVIPEGCYSLERTSLSIAAGKFVSEPFRLTVKNTDKLESDKIYLLPITVKTLTAPEEMPLNEDYKTTYLIISSQIVHFDETLDKSNWEVIEASSVWTDGYETNRMLDGDRSTYWHSALNGMPQWFVVDMKGPKRIKGFYFVHRQETSQTSTPKTVKFEVSMDALNWTTAFETDDFDQSKLRIEVPLNNTIGGARYFRFTCNKTVSEASYTYVAEIGAYSETEVEKPLILSNTPAAGITVFLSEIQNLNFTWVVDKAIAGGYKVLFSKNQNMTSPVEFTSSTTSLSLSKAQIESLKGNDETVTLFWQVTATGGESLATPSEPRSLTLSSTVMTGIPLSFDVTKNNVTVTDGGTQVTLTTTGGDPWIFTTKLGQTLQAGKTYYISFEYKSNKTIPDAEFFYCVDGGPVGGKSSGANITVPGATDWTRFEYVLTTAINNFGFGSSPNHFLRYDLTGDAGYEITIRDFSIVSK